MQMRCKVVEKLNANCGSGRVKYVRGVQVTRIILMSRFKLTTCVCEQCNCFVTSSWQYTNHSVSRWKSMLHTNTHFDERAPSTPSRDWEVCVNRFHFKLV